MIILTSLSKSSQAGSVIAARRCVRNLLTALALPVVALLSAAPAWALPDLDVSVVTSNPTPAAGAIFNYVVVITNRGTTTATGITLLDPLPDGITFQSATPVTTAGSLLACSGPAVNANGTVSCTGFLLANATSTITISAKVDQTARSGPRINAVGATSTAAEATPDVYPNSAYVRQTVLGAADLGITKVISNATPTAGGAAFSYTLTVTNNGPNDAMGIVVLDPLPPGVIFQNVAVVNNPSLAGWGLTCSGPPNATSGTVQCTGNLPGPTTAPAATSTSTITIVAQIVARVTSGVRTNTASVASNNPQPTPTNTTLPNTASVQLNIVVSAPLSITKAGPATVSPGATIVYQITVNNSGSSTALNAIISDPLPANTSFLSMYGTGTFHEVCRHSGGTPGTVSCPAVDIPSGQQSLNIVVRLAPNAPLGSLANTATITTAGTGTIAGGTATTTAIVQ